uniref:Geranyl hydroquinone hydroxylase n=1 Tax=Echium plantagineum TaxID=113446 RepID=A0A8A2MHM5_ECHPN|nr:geranyl hydroquinone hydroxylase [Echium plantagineum]
MEYTTILLGVLIGYVILKAITRKSKNLPPGPHTLPIIGNLHLVGSIPHKSILKLAEKYGPIMSLQFGQIPTIVVSSPSMAKEILQKQDISFAGKRIPDALNAHNHWQFSVVWLPANSLWRTLRKILTSNIFTNNRLEASQHLRSQKVRDLVAYCKKSGEKGEAVEIGQAAYRTSLNLLSSTIFSKDLADYYSETGAPREFKDAIWNILVESVKPNLADFFPILSMFDLQGIKQRASVHFGKGLKIMEGLVNERLEHRELHGATHNDILDIFLNYCDEHPDEIDRHRVKHTILDLFIAGTDTTSSVTEWTMAELIKNPQVMKRAKDELAQVIGRGKSLEESDVARLPYLRCIMKEALRKHPPGPFLFPRRPEEDVEVAGYTIPKGSQVLVSIYALGRDPNSWEDPLAFKPERFLDSELDFRGNHFEMLPFGAGRRSCPGLPMAVRMVPLLLGSLINSFDWELADGMKPEELSMEEKVGLTAQLAHPLKIVPIPVKEE